MSDFLFEIGLEEIPARMIAGAQAELLKRVSALLERERLIPAGSAATSYSTPRRLAVHVPAVLERQPDLTEELLGPATKIAYKDGAPGPAALAFAKKSGVAVEDLRTVSTPKGDYVAATSTKPGRTAAEVLTAELPKELAGIYWAKNMYWRAGKPERFVRPVRWLVALLGEEVVPVSFGGYTAGRETYGHRVLFGPQPIVLKSPSDYVAQLTAAHVMADVELRRHTIRKALDHVCRTLPDTRWREDHALVDKMTHLTEWPSVIAGDFESAYLELPQEVLVTVMRDHQNYFAVEARDGELAPHFLAVLNTEADAAGQAVIRHGNARVLRARFNDARFFWQFDQRISLEERRMRLCDVTFHKDLGSYWDKAGRVGSVIASFETLTREQKQLEDFSWGGLYNASNLAKTDLTTELVKEFTELQGQVGGLYARAQGHPEAVAAAIYDQYRPASMDDRIPATPMGQLLGLADRIDTISSMFGLGLEPTGSRDPFALRRAGNGIVRILAESSLPLTLAQVASAPRDQAPETGEKVIAFLRDRVEFYLREAKGLAYDVVKAVMAASADNLPDLVQRAEALTAARGSQDFLAICAAFKRMRNIVAQAWSEPIGDDVPDPDKGEMPEAQYNLAREVAGVGYRFDQLAQAHDYGPALELLATLRPVIDDFFDKVMVLSPNRSVRMGRVVLLQDILNKFSLVADFSEIVTGS